jgi:aspartyl-tRNA(Asn)/glutamyl-tRNA(Gln) amidotransferase subunit B
MAEHEAVIGAEIHAELSTRTKMFCSCENRFGAEPNTLVCPVCTGLPGVLPVVNRQAVEFVVKVALALNCEISEKTLFNRKNYFYPDLPKGYQISQYGENVVGKNGWLEISSYGAKKRIGIRRVHMEEDTGKLFHVEGEGATGQKSEIDFNRAGVPLVEIVSEPDMRSADEARDYLQRVRDIVTSLGASDGKMEEGSLRCECNVSIRPVGSTELGTKVEMKNLNSFRAVHKAIDYEIQRQIGVLESGAEVVHETRRWEEAQDVTAPMRTKEFEADYRYFPEPDLVPLRMTDFFVNRMRSLLPELPHQKAARIIEQYGIPEYDAEVLTDSAEVASFYEECVKAGGDPKAVSNWVMGELLRLLKETEGEFSQIKVKPEQLVQLLKLIEEGKISAKIAKEVFDKMWESGGDPEKIVADLGVSQLSDEAELEKIIEEVCEANPDVVAKIKSGERKAIGFLVGEVMKRTKGRANPKLVNQLMARRFG